MLLPSYFIVEIEKYDRVPDVQLPENSYLCYKISSDSIDLISSFYRNLFLFPKNQPFCLLIDFTPDSVKSKTLLELIVSISFHSSYIKNVYDNPYVLFELEKSDTNEYISIVREAFKAQGYTDIEVILMYKNHHFLSDISDKYVRFDLGENIDGLPSAYINSIKTLTFFQFSFYFLLAYPGNLPQALKIIDDAESTIRKDLPQTYSLLNEGKFLMLKENELISKSQLVEDQSGSLDGQDLDYNSTIDRYKKQVTELLKFYKREYEILPLWYKRFGHIIKVIIGKRTFKSLFKDGVEKYKE